MYSCSEKITAVAPSGGCVGGNGLEDSDPCLRPLVNFDYPSHLQIPLDK